VLYSEGVFGRSIDPMLIPETLALADRGLVMAVAHVRGAAGSSDRSGTTTGAGSAACTRWTISSPPRTTW
jgi:hypothetical protein